MKTTDTVHAKPKTPTPCRLPGWEMKDGQVSVGKQLPRGRGVGVEEAVRGDRRLRIYIRNAAAGERALVNKKAIESLNGALEHRSIGL